MSIPMSLSPVADEDTTLSLEDFCPTYDFIPVPPISSPPESTSAPSWQSTAGIDQVFGQVWPTSATLEDEVLVSEHGSGDQVIDNPMDDLSLYTGFSTSRSTYLSHSSSTSSLNTFASVSPSDSYSNGLLVQPSSTLSTFEHDLTSQPTYAALSSLDNKHELSNHFTAMDISGFRMPTGDYKPVIPLVGADRQLRARSSSRVTPYYPRHNQVDSISSTQSINEYLPAKTISYPLTSAPPWQTTTMVHDNGPAKMTLHHRRTSSRSSNWSPIKRMSSRPLLSRPHRSASLSLLKQARVDRRDAPSVSPTVDEDDRIRLELKTRAEQALALSNPAQQDKARSQWVRLWLRSSYTIASGFTVPRQGLHHSYTLSCQEFGLKPINSASFGKAVRSAFNGIKTRRLGVRGNSKYHYVSLRPALRVEAQRLNEYGDSSGKWHYTSHDGVLAFDASTDAEMSFDDEDDEDGEAEDDEEDFPGGQVPGHDLPNLTPFSSISRPRAIRRHTTAAATSFAEYRPAPTTSIPNFPTETMVITACPHIHTAVVRELWQGFEQHQHWLVAQMELWNLTSFEANIRHFWANLSPAHWTVCQNEQFGGLLRQGIAASYDRIVDFLMSKCQAALSVPTQVSLRSIAMNLENTYEQSMAALPIALREEIAELAVRASHLILRILDLQQVSSSLLPILSDPEQVGLMLELWQKLDIRMVVHECALSTAAPQDLVHTVLTEFHHWISGLTVVSAQNAIERLSSWIANLLKRVQDGDHTTPGHPIHAIVTRVGFLTSQIVRDFTLKSDSSFGRYQLLKTWIDDWISITAVREFAFSCDNRAPLPGMSVAIPPSTFSLNGGDLPTAVPTLPKTYSASGHTAQGASMSSTALEDPFGLPQFPIIHATYLQTADSSAHFNTFQ